MSTSHPATTALFIVLFLVPGIAAGQARVTIGTGTWTLEGELRSESSLGSVTRLTAGVGYAFPLRGAFSLRPELVYSVKGAAGDTRLDGVPVRATFDLGYIDAPILLVWTWQRPSGPRPSLFAGPVLSYKIDARVRFRSPDGGPSFSDTDDTVRSRGTALLIGAEAAFGFSDVEWFVGARYMRGISNVRDADPALRHAGGMAYLGVTL